TLRRRGRYDEALEALELAVGVYPSARAELAAFACAVAVHLVAGSHETARKVAGSVRRQAEGAAALTALGEGYLGLFRGGGEPPPPGRPSACLELAALEDAAASA